MISFCSQCGKSIHEGSRFCPQCGISIRLDASNPVEYVENHLQPLGPPEEVVIPDKFGLGRSQSDQDSPSSKPEGKRRIGLAKSWGAQSKQRRITSVAIAVLLVVALVGVLSNGHRSFDTGRSFPAATAAEKCYAHGVALLYSLFRSPEDMSAVSQAQNQLVGEFGSNSVQFMAFQDAYTNGINQAISDGYEAGMTAALPTLKEGCAALTPAGSSGSKAVAPTTATSTTSPPISSGPPCPVNQLYRSAAAHAGAGMTTFYGPGGTKPVTYCHNGWAVLSGFTIQAGSGWGLALYQYLGGAWKFVMFDGETGGGGPGFNPCLQYPRAALKALGKELCP